MLNFLLSYFVFTFWLTQLRRQKQRPLRKIVAYLLTQLRRAGDARKVHMQARNERNERENCTQRMQLAPTT